MSNNASFSAILGMKISDAKRPEPLPRGTYLLNITKVVSGKSPQKKTRFVQYLMQPVEAQEDVEGDVSSIADWQNRTLKSDKFYLVPNAAFRLASFLKTAGLDSSLGFEEAIPGAVNQQILGFVDIEESTFEDDKNEDGSTPTYNKITSYATVA